MLPETSQLRVRLHAWQQVVENGRDGVIAAEPLIECSLTHCGIPFWLGMGNHWLTGRVELRSCWLVFTEASRRENDDDFVGAHLVRTTTAAEGPLPLLLPVRHSFSDGGWRVGERRQFAHNSGRG